MLNKRELNVLNKHSLSFLVLLCLSIILSCRSSEKAVLTARLTELPATVEPEVVEPLPDDQESVDYLVIHKLYLQNLGPGHLSRVDLTVALIQTIDPYQRVDHRTIQPAGYELIDDDDGNQYVFYEITDLKPGDSLEVNIQYTVTVNAFQVPRGDCVGELPKQYLDAEQHIESDAPQIISLATELSSGAGSPCEQSRIFYDYVIDNMLYAGYIPGDRGALAAIRDYIGDCTEFTDVLLALNRASGIPAQFIDGLLCCTDKGYEEGQTKHNWAEVYLPGTGWVPMDPTFGQWSDQRDAYYAGITPDHIIVTRGRRLQTLGGFHYFYFQYWWAGEEAELWSDEEWEVLKIN